MKKTIIIISFVILVLASCWFCLNCCVEDHELYTENIEDYNSKEYPIFSMVFLNSIPSNARVISFSYYDYWSEAFDFYLELRFDDAEDMENYISLLTQNCLKQLEQTNPPSNVGWLEEEQNPYDKSFTDLLCTFYRMSTAYESVTGYRVVSEYEKLAYECNFGIISYSYENLTVIQSYTCGHFRPSIHQHIPKYFVRFNVPINEEHERVIHIER